MRAIRILQDKLEGSLGFMHAKQRAALWRVVEGLLNSQKLCLTALGRGLPGDCVVKHRIKAVDRFVGSAAIQASIPRVYEAIANLLLGSTERPVLLIDWTGAAPGFFTLSAKIAFSGRAVSILSRTYPESKKSNVKVERAFLDELKQILPAHCRPVLVTDAGFFFRWVDSVKAYAWDYIARALQEDAAEHRGPLDDIGRRLQACGAYPAQLPSNYRWASQPPYASRGPLGKTETCRADALGPKGKASNRQFRRHVSCCCP